MKCASRDIAESVEHEWTLHIRCYTQEKENVVAEDFSSHENSLIPSKAQTLGSALKHAGYSFTDSQM